MSGFFYIQFLMGEESIRQMDFVVIKKKPIQLLCDKIKE
jgi:hypothetical protein